MRLQSASLYGGPVAIYKAVTSLGAPLVTQVHAHAGMRRSIGGQPKRREPAVDQDRLAADEIGGRRCEVEHAVRHLLRPAETPERRLVEHRLALGGIAPDLLAHGGEDDRWADRIGLNVMLRPFACH